MVPSRFIDQDVEVFVEIFAVPTKGELFDFSVQRRFEVTEQWFGEMSTVPVCPDRNHYGTAFAPSDVAVLLLQAGVLQIPERRSWCVQYAGSGQYFDSSRDALAYCRKRWPAEMARFTKRLHLGASLDISPSRAAAFEENKAKLQPWNDRAGALAEQIRNNNAAPAEG